MKSALLIAVCEDGKALPQYPRPRDIESLIGCFGKAEVEQAAGRLLEFFRSKGEWCSFSIERLSTFYAGRDWDANTMFFGLKGAYIDDGGMMGYREPADTYIVEDEHGGLNVTNKFIEQCSRNIKQAA